MAQLGKRKGSIIKKRSMPEFKQKDASVFGTVARGLRGNLTSLKTKAVRTVNKAATYEERKTVVKGVKKAAQAAKKVITSKEAKAVGKGVMGFLRTWGASSQAAYEREYGKRK